VKTEGTVRVKGEEQGREGQKRKRREGRETSPALKLNP